MNDRDDNPFAPPISPIQDVRHPKLDYPFGKLTIPWVIALYFGIGVSAGAFFAYALSIHFTHGDLHPLVKPVMSCPLVDDKDDLAGLLSFSCSFSVCAILAASKAYKNWHTWLIAFPSARLCVAAFIRSSLFLAPVWVIGVWFFEFHDNFLPGCRSWFEIACLTGLASFHWFQFKRLMEYGAHFLGAFQAD